MSTLVSTVPTESSSYHHGNLREALLINGFQLLESTEGTDFSMRELTRMIGVSANAVYRHFSSKEQLLIAMATQGFEQLLTAQAQAVQNALESKMGFLNAGREYVYFAMKNPSLFRLMYGRFSVSLDDEKLKSMATLAYTGMLYCAANVLKMSVDAPEAHTIAALAWSVVHGLSHLIIDGQFNHLSKEDLNHMINNVLEKSLVI